MIISRETDYAIRMLKELSDRKQHTVPELAEKGLVPQTFAYKILKKLEKAGIISISRGIAGGCRIAADLKQISLYELVEAIEGSESQNLHVNACTIPGYQCSWCETHGDCAVHDSLEDIQHVLVDELKSHSLDQILGHPVS